MFTSGKMKMMFEIVDTIGDKFIEAVNKEVKQSENFDVQKVLARFTTVRKNSIFFDKDMTFYFS